MNLFSPFLNLACLSASTTSYGNEFHKLSKCYIKKTTTLDFYVASQLGVFSRVLGASVQKVRSKTLAKENKINKTLFLCMTSQTNKR